MTKPPIPFELHDATIVAVSTGPRREVALTIDMYPIVYPNKPRIQLRFGGIVNYEAVQQYMEKLQSERSDDDYLGCRIGGFQYDTKQESNAGDYWFFLETDWYGPLRIHCTNMSMTELP